MKNIDIYDFDKTLYKKDSTIMFYIFCLNKKKNIIKYFPIQSYSFIKYKLKLISKIKFKEKFFIFLKDIDTTECVKDFWMHNKKNIRINLIENNSNNEKVVISASPEFLLRDVCNEIGIDKLIASKVNKNTGAFNSKNCYGEEKVNRLNKEIKEYHVVNFYTDSFSDLPLAKLADNSYLIKNNKLEKWIIGDD